MERDKYRLLQNWTQDALREGKRLLFYIFIFVGGASAYHFLNTYEQKAVTCNVVTEVLVTGYVLPYKLPAT
jgi:hypothetical protein